MGISQQIGASSLIKPGVIDSAAARPASPYEGQVIFQKDTDQLLVWNGTAWVIPNQTTQNPEGLELVKTQAVGTAVSSVSVTDAFSSDYDNYVVLYSGGVGSTSTNISFALGASTTTYYNVLVYGNYAGSTPSLATTNNNRSSFPWCGGANTTFAFMNVTIMQPYLASYTRIAATTYEGTDNAGSMTGIHKTSTSYSAFTLSLEAGTLTGGTIRVYGYRK